MGLFDFFQRKKPTDHLSQLEWDETTVVCRHPNGTVEKVSWADLQRVWIVTTSEGPFVDDVFWCLSDGEGTCTVPSETPGKDRLLERLSSLPGFDSEAVIAAMACADDNEFHCWQRPSS